MVRADLYAAGRGHTARVRPLVPDSGSFPSVTLWSQATLESERLLPSVAALSLTRVRVASRDPAVCAVTPQSRLRGRMAPPPRHGAWAVAGAGERQPACPTRVLLCCGPRGPTVHLPPARCPEPLPTAGRLRNLGGAGGMFGEPHPVTAIAGLRICGAGGGVGSHASSSGTRQRAVPACRAPEMRGRKVGLQEGTHLKDSTCFCKANQNRG